MWKAIITNKSDVDASGRITVTFDIYIDTTLMYPGMQTTCLPTDVTTNMTTITQDLKTNYDNAQTIQVGQEVTI